MEFKPKYPRWRFIQVRAAEAYALKIEKKNVCWQLDNILWIDKRKVKRARRRHKQGKI